MIEYTMLDAALSAARARRRLPAPSARRRIRQRAGVTTVVLARVLGVTPATITRWELGLREPGGSHLENYLALLDHLVRKTNGGGDR